MNNLPEKMKAIVCYTPDDYRLEMVDTPCAREGEIIVKVEACGICTGDVKAKHGAARFWGDQTHPSYCEPPFIPGHEFLGHIVELGSNVKGDFQIGDRVISEQIAPCWECRFCKRGQHWMCEVHDVYGFKGHLNGGMAEYARFPKNSLVYKVPHDLETKSAVLIEPFACSKHAVDRANVSNEDFVVLSGAGTLGLGMVTYLRMKNPQTIAVLDMQDERLALAKEYGADLVMNPQKENVVNRIKELTGGYGCDVYIEATGHVSSVQQGLDAIRRLGTFVEFSVFSGPCSVDWSIISDEKELDLLGAHLSPHCYEPVIQWMSEKKLQTKGVVSHEFSLDDWEEAFAIAEKGGSCGGSLKIVLRP